jgi:transcriptional regulator with XRE-family HTH domain
VTRKRKQATEPRQRFTGPIHDRIRTARKAKGLTQEELGSLIRSDRFPDGIGKQAVCHWEKGIARPDVTNLPKLAEVLGVSATTLLRDLLDNEKAA